MASFSRALLPLCACFRGEIPPRADWTALIALANHTLTTPSLIAFVRSHRAAIPEEVAAYAKELHDRNAIRNDRLSAQLEEAVLALNGVGITPLLIKGAAMLATGRQSDRALRLMSDLDLIVRPDQVHTAMTTLAAIGYSIDYETDGRHKKWYADLKRPLDVGMIDLHNELPGHSFLDQTPDGLRSQLRMIRLGAANALVPSPELQALVLVMHDQFQDYGYWTGSIDLRHLLDLRALNAAPGGIRWDVLMTMVSGTLVRNAVETQLLLLTTLFDVKWPAHHPKRPVPRLQVWRQLLQARFPRTRYPLLPMALLDLGSHHRATAGSQAPGERKRRWFPKLSTLRLLMSLSRRYPTGKI
ncbi:nucleotidyltransferase family protein [Tardiphaga sp. P9-11]|uniref:nucleotidyltransferase family protein n=1 Tax=Tardiphaga sp. P9-11 TaxID=2024614 RepID=UPI0011F3C0A1|nr:nucleotidyltransferase family protein [Tardiphaga sp. P9-11]KAA0072955.1 hypothetical protein CIW50_22385 [Tardiphaga sp. P9-11]